MSNASDDWWRHGIVYQIYVRSFADGTGDGTGDIAGIRSRLGYLADLGIDAIWVNPWYRSPLLDGGYDVADYREIDERFGTVADAEAFIREAGEHGIRVILDLVPNHTSWDHRWFREALAAERGSPARQRYHFLDGRGPDGAEPPNNWRSVFGGSAWSRVDDGQWYLHLFDESQPDVNWENLDVRAEFEAVMRFWLDLGAAGFRIDVAHGLAKEPGYPDVVLGDSDTGSDAPLNDGKVGPRRLPYFDLDEIHPIVRSWRRVLDEYDGRMMVAEAWVPAERRPLYLRPDEYHQAFDFDLLSAPWDAAAFSRIIESSLSLAGAVGSVPTWVLSNHDVVRHATRYGLPADVDSTFWLLDGPHDVLDAERGRRRARAAALLTFALPGSAYLYQGDELALPEVWDLPPEVLDDPVWHDSGERVKGRDGCRVPIPWTPTGPSLGFGDAEPWLPQPETFAEISVAAQDGDPDSTLTLYRTALRLRSELLRGIDDVEFLPVAGGVDAGVIAFTRGERFTCVVNMGDVDVRIPDGDVILASGPVADGVLPPDTTAWIV